MIRAVKSGDALKGIAIDWDKSSEKTINNKGGVVRLAVDLIYQ